MNKRENETIGDCISDSKETKLAVDVSNATKKHFRIVEMDKRGFIEFDEDVENPFGMLRIDENSIVFDLSNGGLEVLGVEDLLDEIDDVFVVPFTTASKYDANILVIMD